MTGAGGIDPLVSLVIVGIIFWQTWGLLRETLEMAMVGVPRGIDDDAVRMTLPGVSRVHDLHIWPMSTAEPVLTAHLGDSGRKSGRRLPAGRPRRAARSVRHRPRDAAGGDGHLLYHALRTGRRT